MAFQAALRGGGSGVYAGGGPAIATVAESASGRFSEVCSHPDINRDGSACFYATTASGACALFLVRGGEVIEVAAPAGPLGPTMNEAGTVAFRADAGEGGGGIFIASGAGAVATIARATGRFSGFHGLPVINRAGTVAFRADLGSGGEGIYVADGERVTAVIETGGDFSGLGAFPVINDAGTVAFCATRRAGGSGVFTSRGGRIETVPDTGGPFGSFRGVLLDNSGRTVFYATPRGGTLGVFFGPDPNADCLLSVGSPLSGSTVEEFALNPVSINGAGQLAIRVALADRREFILRADPCGQS